MYARDHTATTGARNSQLSRDFLLDLLVHLPRYVIHDFAGSFVHVFRGRIRKARERLLRRLLPSPVAPPSRSAHDQHDILMLTAQPR